MADYSLSESELRARRPDGTFDVYAIDYFEALVHHNGSPSNAVIPDADTIGRYRGRLPDDLLKFWSQHGWGSWANGKFWLCDPEIVHPVLEAVFGSDPEFDPAKMTAYGYDAFGQIEIWLGEGARMRLDLVNAYVSVRPREFIDQFDRWDTDHRIVANTILLHIFDLEVMPDDNGADLFPRAVEALGELQPGEIYGYVPAQALGGPRKLANIQRVPVVEHLVLLNALEPPVLHRYIPPPPGSPGFGNVVPVRTIGR